MKNTKSNVIDVIAPRLTELMIRKIETLTTDWHKPWIAQPSQGLPRNLRGTFYHAGNVLMLSILTELEKYAVPVFMTCRQANDEGYGIRKGQKSFPVWYWKKYVRHKDTRRKIEYDDYCLLPPAEKKNYDVIPVLRYYPVFNIDQTDMQEKNPVRYAKIIQRQVPKNCSDGFCCPSLDRMLEQGEWFCPVELHRGDESFYNRLTDRIVCPLKSQFPEGAAFYGALLHEMAHSTGHPARLNRKKGAQYGDADYAREELVAELTAALCGMSLGISNAPREGNAAYLKGWLEELKREPSYLFDVLADVKRAAQSINELLAVGDVRENLRAA